MSDDSDDDVVMALVSAAYHAGRLATAQTLPEVGAVLSLLATLRRERDELRGDVADLLAAARAAIPPDEYPADKTANNWASQIRALGDDRRAAYKQRDGARGERDMFRAECASISEEFGLPPTIRPVEGEIRRMRADLAKMRADRDGFANAMDLELRRLGQIAKALGVTDYIDSIGPLLDAIDRLRAERDEAMRMRDQALESLRLAGPAWERGNESAHAAMREAIRERDLTREAFMEMQEIANQKARALMRIAQVFGLETPCENEYVIAVARTTIEARDSLREDLRIERVNGGAMDECWREMLAMVGLSEMSGEQWRDRLPELVRTEADYLAVAQACGMVLSADGHAEEPLPTADIVAHVRDLTACASRLTELGTSGFDADGDCRACGGAGQYDQGLPCHECSNGKLPALVEERLGRAVAVSQALAEVERWRNEATVYAVERDEARRAASTLTCEIDETLCALLGVSEEDYFAAGVETRPHAPSLAAGITARLLRTTAAGERLADMVRGIDRWLVQLKHREAYALPPWGEIENAVVGIGETLSAWDRRDGEVG